MARPSPISFPEKTGSGTSSSALLHPAIGATRIRFDMARRGSLRTELLVNFDPMDRPHRVDLTPCEAEAEVLRSSRARLQLDLRQHGHPILRGRRRQR